MPPLQILDGHNDTLTRIFPPADDTSAKLQELADLHAKGVLSDEEFAAAKAKALGI